MPHEPRTASYLLRLTPREKRELEQLADRARVVLADAMRIGARSFLLGQRLQAAAPAPRITRREHGPPSGPRHQGQREPPV